MVEPLACDPTARPAVVRRSMELYDERLDRGRVVELSGRHRPAVEEATAKTVAWGTEIGRYVRAVFGDTSALNDRQPYGPVLAVLPRNDRGDLAPYVLAQCVLAGCGYVVRPSSREASAYVTRTYHDCLLEATRDVLDAGVARSVADRLDIIEPMADRDTLARLAEASPEAGQLVLFGDDETVETIRTGLADAMAIQNTARLGTGRSSSVLTPTDSNLESWCRAIVASASFDKGDDCTNTSVLYVVGDSDFYADAIAELEDARDALSPGTNFARPAEDELDAAADLACTFHPGTDVSPDRLDLVECARPTPVVEYPVPVLQVKFVPDRSTLVDVMGRDFAEVPSLVTTVYADDPDTWTTSDVPTRLVKHNRPTHDVDLLEPHQGVYLVAELLEN